MDDISFELMLNICSRLDAEGILNSSKVSKRYNRLAEPFPSKTIILHTTLSSCVLQLVRSVSERPVHIGFIESITILERRAIQKYGCEMTYFALVRDAEAQELISGDQKWFHRIGSRFGWALAELSILFQLLHKIHGFATSWRINT